MRIFLLSTIIVAFMIAPIKFISAQNIDPYFVVLCEDGRQIVGYNLILEDLTPDSSLRVTMVGARDFDPAFATIDDDETIICANNTERAAGSTVAIPGLGRVEANNFAAQRTILVPRSGNLNLVVGGYPGQAGQFGVVIENMSIETGGGTDIMRVNVPPAALTEWVNVFMVGSGSNLDPVMNMYFERAIGQPEVTCDNAGTRTCQDVPELIDRGAVISEGDIYAGDAFDAGIMGAYQQEQLVYEFKDVSTTNTGNYIIAMSATAPGAVVDTSFICTNVVDRVIGSSPSYNPAYSLENIIDGDPSTFWVTGVPNVNPQTGQPDQNAFVAIAMQEEELRINKIRINGYAAGGEELVQNSLQNFAVRFPNADGEVVTAVEGQLLAQPGYQSFSFIPATVSDIGIIFLSNYGGTLYTVVDIQVCAAP